MPRQTRFQLGLYYLVLRQSSPRSLFADHTAYAIFIDVLTTVLEATGYRLFAIAVLPGQVHLAVQMSQLPLSDFVQRLVLKVTARLRQRREFPSPVLEQTHGPRLIDENGKLRELIRFIHLLPIKVQPNVVEYAWSGHRTYLGLARLPCMAVRAGLRLFDADPGRARELYNEYVRQGLETILARSAEHTPASASSRAPPASADAPEAPLDSLERLAVRAAELANRPLADIRSSSRERLYSLLRAFIAWHAIELNIATLAEVARYLRRDSSTLCVAIKRYRELYRPLFSEPGRLEGIAAVASTRVNGRRAAAQERADGPQDSPSRSAVLETPLARAG